MFAKRRMFWNVLPIPAWTISLGLALRKMPPRLSSWTYQRGRTIAARNIVARAKMAMTAPPAAISAELVTAKARAASTPPTEPNVAGGGIEDADDDVEERRLAGAVRADEADDRALRDLEVDLANRDQTAEGLRDLPCLEDELGGLRGHRRGGHQSPIAAVGGGRSPTSAVASCSSRCLRRLGNRPSGRNSIMPTSARP